MPDIPLNPTAEDPGLMRKIIANQSQSPANVEDAGNPNSILNKPGSGIPVARLHGDATRHPLNKQFVRQPTKGTP